jgi:hypothetical protein
MAVRVDMVSSKGECSSVSTGTDPAGVENSPAGDVTSLCREQMPHGRWPEEDWVANSSLSTDMAALSSRPDSPAARVRLAVSFRDLSDQDSEHGIGLVNGHVEGSLVCRRR